MNAIKLMVEEHKNIKRVLIVIRKLCLKVLQNEEVDYDVFYKIIDFVRNYADKHHHSKEEDILFKKMSEELKDVVGEGPILGMLTEHDQGRLFIKNLEQAVKRVQDGNYEAKLDVIANAIAYTDLLYRHIDKEDNVIYKFGERKLSVESLNEVEAKCEEAERLASEKNIQDKYLKIVNELEGVVSNY